MRALQIAVFGAALLTVLPAFAGEVVDRIVAVVNKDVVLQSDVDELMELVGEQELRGLSGTDREQAAAELVVDLIDGLIANKLIEQAMDRADIEISDREVEGAIADVANSNGMTVEKLFDELKRQGIDPDEYRTELRKQLRQYQFMNLEIRARVEVTDEDIRQAWIQAQQGGNKGEVGWQLNRILLSIPAGSDDAAVQAIRDEAAALVQQVTDGKAFDEIARVRSDDTSTRDKGGDAGIFKPGDLGAAFADALGAAEVGQVVSIELPTGIWLLQIASQVDVGEKEFEQMRDQIARHLYDAAMERELELWTDEERRKAHVEIFL